MYQHSAIDASLFYDKYKVTSFIIFSQNWFDSVEKEITLNHNTFLYKNLLLGIRYSSLLQKLKSIFE